MIRDIDLYIAQHQEVITKVYEDPVLKEKILNVSDILIRAYRNKKRFYLFGCGGSAADA